MVNLRVVDIYHGDRVSSFKKAADFGIWGIIHKATTGATGKDANYPIRRKPASNAALLWGAYHWGTKADVAKQVKNFLDYAEPDQSTLVALDFQRTGANTMTLDQAREFLSRIEEELRRKAVIYSGELIKTRLGRKKDPFFGAHRLWLAHYNVHPSRAEELGQVLGSGNTRITQRASNPTECQVFRATRKAILTAILMTARGRNSTTNGRPSQAAIASRAYRSISLQSASNGSQRHAELLRELREIKREINSVPKKRDLSLVAYVILGTIALLFLFRDILGWVFSH
jgi:hypothetical protein